MAEPLLIANRLPTANPAAGIRLGLLRAEGVDAQAYPLGFEEALDVSTRAVIEAPRAEGELEARRRAARDMLRNGRYKPTGRGKPASEYLVGAAGDRFPRINALVDICNMISMVERLPISLWDLDRAEASRFVFRLGREAEAYVFNPGGQTLDVLDLVVGCRVREGAAPEGEPIVSPIKDSQPTKTSDGTDRVVACVYAPVNVGSESTLSEICAGFARWLMGCGTEVEVVTAVASPGAEVRL